MTDERDTDPNVAREGDPTWLGPDYPVKTPAELALEDAQPRVKVRSFADRWGSPWLLIPLGLVLLAGFYKLLFHG